MSSLLETPETRNRAAAGTAGSILILMQVRRLTRLTNAFSKKLNNLKNAMALHFAYYNFVRVHSTLRVAPAVAAGLERYAWSLGEF